MRLDELRPTKGSVHRRKRVGRGYASGQGGHESGKGTKGQNSRSGARVRPGFEGGQTPIWMRFPKRGFRNPSRIEYACVNLATLEERFPPQTEVTLAVLREAGLVKGRVSRLKILGSGELTKPLIVRADRFTRTAREKIEEAGGKAEGV